jgi:hypothetical protein
LPLDLDRYPFLAGVVRVAASVSLFACADSGAGGQGQEGTASAGETSRGTLGEDIAFLSSECIQPGQSTYTGTQLAYGTATGQLVYDADDNGTASTAVLIATFNETSLACGDFEVI